MNYRKLNTIVFSDEPRSRWRRHCIFWLAIYFYHLLRIGIMLPSLNNSQALFSLLQTSFCWGLVPVMFCCYATIYYLTPKYLNKKRYVFFITGLVAVLLVMEGYGIIYNTLASNTPVSNAIYSNTRFTDSWLMYRPGAIRLLGNPPLIFGLFLSLKTLKNWHVEQLRTETLAKENANAELQLLKAQVHPHFLFNTLNNIYSFTLTQPPLAGSLVQKLSDMLNYMTDECEQQFVPLEKEIKLIRDYVGLEKVRYGERLDMQIKINGEVKNRLIAPLLMIPFVENCFKHGASVTRGRQWIKLVINIEEDELDFMLSNSKPAEAIVAKAKQGIGLLNVRKRLELIYPHKHVLQMESAHDTYSVHMQVKLQKNTAMDAV